ncbi:MAG: ABC transporter ATP-binding protein [Bacteroidales bacterium]|nr:ABC transporter ATP-binding protein [Bacteroidales bacterium]MCF8333058.1 ABC transporter ATP-binding protein [Bacteroidales bacterium]
MNNTTLQTRNLAIGHRANKQPQYLQRGLHLALHEGELNCILGPNGAGKSTLIKTLAGFVEALEGEIYLMGAPRTERSFKKLSHLMSVVLTDRIQIPHSRVLDIVGMGRYPYTSIIGRFDQHDRKIVVQALKRVGIEEMKHRFFDELSDGEKQKVMIAKALAQDTPVIILDEPTAFLDFPSKIEVMQILLGLAKDTGKSVLMSTHDVELALQVADQIWLMDKGKELHTGSPEDLVLNNVLNYFFEKDYIYFDKYTGTFLLKTRNGSEIYTDGPQPYLFWLNKALSRIGFNTTEKGVGEPRVVIKAKDDILLLLPDKTQTKFTSIESLISFLKNEV